MVKTVANLLLTLSMSVALAAGSDKDKMNKARELYEKGKLDAAVDIYSKIQPSSDFWLEALEERAWAHTRQGKFEDALADLQSITSPVWAPQVGPETYMLSTFVSLKICAYKDVIKKVDIFKKRMLPRVEALESMIDQPMSEETWKTVSKLKKSTVSMSSLGQTADKFPRYFYRDSELISLVKKGLREKAEARMKVLAKADLAEIETNLKKMKIIDIELIQNVLTLDKDQTAKAKDLKFSGTDKNKTMTFPVSGGDDEVWVDEVGHFQVKAENCPYKGASL
ncbi:MAG: tetratricopeptide repeat protein [Bdellovibrionaceae bacterium]|nr:tetratricopeptide repeat protein [Pseudobdellovibrionaceae bacterium]